MKSGFTIFGKNPFQKSIIKLFRKFFKLKNFGQTFPMREWVFYAKFMQYTEYQQI
jgi:hypothetical protein